MEDILELLVCDEDAGIRLDTYLSAKTEFTRSRIAAMIQEGAVTADGKTVTKPYVKTAALGAKVKGNDYRSIDIGIAAAYLTAEATAQGLATCILGWLDDHKLREICGLDGAVRLVITLGYAADDTLRPKARKTIEELVTYLGD